MMSRQKTFNTYRQTYPAFVYESYHYDVQPDGLHIAFSFLVADRGGKHPIVFKPSAFVPSRTFLSFNQDAATMDALVFHIGMAELVSYWKCFCPPVVEVRCGSLDEKQIAFWRKLYYYGLGEFFYTNGITVSEAEFMTIRTIGQLDIRTSGQSDIRTSGQSDIRTIGCSDNPSHPTIRPIQKFSFLVPIGGGKDSVVTLELLRSAGATIRPLILNPRGATTDCAAAAGFGVDETLVIQRTLDPTMLHLNSQGALNGHTPFSALLAFYSLLAAQLSGIPSIALSNENSANESTVAGTTVNHQYSKSVEFEHDFRQYVAAWLGDYNYFSMLRPLCELQIALLFARTERYFDIFRSCNVGSKQDIWCGHCAKCLFAYIILSPFIAPDRLAAIFGRNLLDDGSMLPLLQELAGCTEAKPFECVGTVEEVRAALALTRHRWYTATPLPALLTTDIPLPSPTAAAALLTTFASDHFLDDKLLQTLTDAVNLQFSIFNSQSVPSENPSHSKIRPIRKSVPSENPFFNSQFSKVLLAGYGREGQSTHRFLREHCPDCNVTIAHDDKEMVELLTGGQVFDWVVKSPGIPMSRLCPYVDAARVTSQTDLFLQRYAHQTVGITGTKGKSTTTTLIAHILQHACCHSRANGNLPLQQEFQFSILNFQFSKVLLAGNMGIPLFDIVPQITDDTIVVAELSCHQLQGIRRAPHIGVLLNLYQEHLDHYDSYRDYQMAKMQLMLRQQPGDVCFYCADSPDLAALVDELRPSLLAEIVAYNAADVAADVSAQWPSHLVGDHNRSNIYVATRVARRLGVSDAESAAAVASFEGLPHRLQRVGTYGGITFYNDSISTIPEATIAALNALPRVDTLILGGFDRGIDYTPLVSFLAADTALLNIVFVGAAGHRISKLLNTKQKQQFNNSITQQFNTFHCDDYPSIVDWCFRHTPAGGVCLLSPAAASYDAFKNFEHRGETFCELVKLKSS